MTDPRTGLEATKDNVLRRTLLAPDHSFQDWVWGYEAEDHASRRPSTITSGVALSDSQVALVGLRLRSAPHKRSSWLRFDQVTPLKTYGLEADGVLIGEVTGENAAVDAATSLVAQITGNSHFTTNLGGSVEQLSEDGGLQHIIRVDLDLPVQVKIGDSHAGGEFASSVVESSWCVWRVWGLLKGLDVWVEASDTFVSTKALDTREVECAPYSRIFVEIIASDGAVLPIAGGGKLPGSLGNAWEEAAKQLSNLLNATFFTWPSDSGLEGVLSPRFSPSSTKGEAGPRIHFQGMVSVPNTGGDTKLLEVCAKRRGFIVHNQGGDDVHLLWLVQGGDDEATTDHRKLAPDNIWYEAGEDVPSHALVARAAGGGAVNVWVEDRR